MWDGKYSKSKSELFVFQFSRLSVLWLRRSYSHSEVQIQKASFLFCTSLVYPYSGCAEVTFTRKCKSKKRAFCFALLSFIRNFAGVRLRKIRHIASLLLLTVFLSMQFLSYVHVHTATTSTSVECSGCVANHCQGHILPLDASIDNCVICQFLALVFVAAAIAATLSVFSVSSPIHVRLLSCVVLKAPSTIVTRGPPVCPAKA